MVKFAREYRAIDLWVGVGRARHSIFVKEHTDKVEAALKGRVLFVGNIDFGGRMWSHEDVRGLMGDLFGGFGDIESISVSEFQQQQGGMAGVESEGHSRRNARFAHVVFEKRSAVRAALQAGDDLYARLGREVVGDKWGALSGAGASSGNGLLTVKELQAAYGNSASSSSSSSASSASELRAEADEFMRDFEEKERLALEEQRRRRGQTDEDGFVLVTSRKGGRKRRRDEQLNKRGTGGPRTRAKRKSYELRNFYRFQQKEERRNRLAELRRRFEEDKARVAHLKEARKFKPF